MRGAAIAVAMTLLAIAGCGLATSGLFDPSSTTTGPDASGTAPPVTDGSPFPAKLEAGVPGGDAGDDASGAAGNDAGDGSSAGPDAACALTNDAGAIATIAAWPGPPPPTIDGNLSEWPCEGRIDLTDANAAYVKDPTHPLAAQIEVRWDMQNIYFAMHVVDATVGGTDAVNPYNNDSVEVYVSGDATLDGDYDAQTHQYITDWKGLIVDYGPTHAGGAADTVHAHFVAAAGTASDGWTFEASLGWQALYAGGSNSFTSGTNLALDFEVNDGDGTSQVAALILTMAPAQTTCTCTQACCCGQTPDVPYCDSARIGRVTLE